MNTQAMLRRSRRSRRNLKLEPLEIRLALTEVTVAALAEDASPTEPVSASAAYAVDSIAATADVEIMKAPNAGNGGGKGGGKPDGESAGNNLSFPVIWSEGVQKVLPGTPGMTPILNGEWWYQWGTNGEDPNIQPASFPPDPDATDPTLNPDGLPLGDDGVAGAVDVTLDATTQPADHPLDPARAYLQKDQNNVWQAQSADWSDQPVDVHWIDWGDNLESVDWTIRSQVRTEVVLYQDLFRANEAGVLEPTDERVGTDPWLEYEMRHTDGWGINEVHGAAATIVDPTSTDVSSAILGPGTQATVYTNSARLTIQKLLVDREDPSVDSLVWVADTLETDGGYYIEPDGVPAGSIISPPIFNMPVYEGGDGPGYYSAEVNVKGRVIFGYTWNVRKLNEGVGDYRITFSLDDQCLSEGQEMARNTFFTENVTNIIEPIEEVETDGESPEVGARAVLDYTNELTYIDIRIVDKGGSGGGGPKDKVATLTALAPPDTNLLVTGDNDEAISVDEEAVLIEQVNFARYVDQVIPELTEVREREAVEVTVVAVDDLAEELATNGGVELTAFEAAFAALPI